jgi:predicted dehydrogenase
MSSTSNTIRWGILGTGFIAGEFVRGLQFLPGAKVGAVGSRTLNKAQEFAHRFAVPQAYGSYEELVSDRTVDVIYIATPHSRHRDDCILCLEAGKPILCEKPFTINAREAREVIDLARQKQLFCMEAMWMRFLPIIQQVRQMIRSGAIGEICTLTADFGYPAVLQPDNRFFNLKLGGGALLDRGVYPLSLAFHLLGTPSNITSQANIGKTGVDEQSAILLTYPQGELAILSASLQTYATNEAVIAGKKGQIRIYAPFYRPTRLSISYFSEPTASEYRDSGNSSKLKQQLLSNIQAIPLLHRLYHRFGSSLVALLRRQNTNIFEPYHGNGYNYEADEVMRCLRSGERESHLMPLDETLRIMETMDIIRSQWNLKYPQDL